MNNLATSDKNNIWHPFTPLIGADNPIIIKSGRGIYLTTDDGRQIMDCISSWWVNLHGHSNEEIARAIYTQALELEHVIFAGFTHEPAIKLSENLLTILPDNMSRIFFSDDGSTAVEVGLKMALQYWENQGIVKKKIVALEGAYHGDTFGAMSVGARGLFTHPFNDYLFEVEFLPFPTNGSTSTVTRFQEIAATGDVALFIYEPLVQGAAGMRIYSPEILTGLLQIAQTKNIVTVADEVFTGFGRTGNYFASDYVKIKPDIMAVSKGITGGALPLGVTACSGRILESFKTADFSKTFFHGHSYTANPIACAAANASFEILTRKSTFENISRISKSHAAFVEKVKYHDNVLNVRSLGTILAIEIKSDDDTSYENSARKQIYSYFLSRNILLRPLGNVFYVLPPYIITDAELSHVYETILEFLNQNTIKVAE